MTLPPEWTAQFDGTNLEAKVGVSAILATIDGRDWPHVAYLSCGEILAMAPDRVRLCLWPGSGTAQNLKATGRASLHAAADGVVWETRLMATRLSTTGPLFMAELAVVGVLRHRAPYARVRGMIDFELLDLPATLDRWRNQIAQLRALAQ